MFRIKLEKSLEGSSKERKYQVSPSIDYNFIEWQKEFIKNPAALLRETPRMVISISLVLFNWKLFPGGAAGRD